jgi:hypothetical protein
MIRYIMILQLFFSPAIPINEALVIVVKVPAKNCVVFVMVTVTKYR